MVTQQPTLGAWPKSPKVHWTEMGGSDGIGNMVARLAEMEPHNRRDGRIRSKALDLWVLDRSPSSSVAQAIEQPCCTAAPIAVIAEEIGASKRTQRTLQQYQQVPRRPVDAVLQSAQNPLQANQLEDE